MFLHNFKYEILSSIRVKDLIMWLILFPIILGTFMKIAFGSIYENDTIFSTIPTAVVENEKSEIFHSVIDALEKSDQPLLKVSYMSEDEAMKALENDDVKGIIFVETTGASSMESKLSLKIKKNGIEQTILKEFTKNYSAQESIMKDAIENNPANIGAVTETLSKEMTITSERPMTDGNTDPFVAYMYNLVAMVAMFGCITGLHVATANQANLSQLGARKNCSPTPKMISIVANLLGSFIVQGVCTSISITFQVLVLGIDYGTRLPLVYLGGFVGGVLGVSMGFFVGSISTWSENLKIGILMGLTMALCFLSGLMFGDMKAIIELNIPILNDLNPSAIIADSLYYLNMDADLGRFFFKIISMIAYSAVFMTGGFLLTRRRKYASL